MADNGAWANRRKILIVDRDFQNKFIARFFAMVAIGSVVTGGIVYFFCGRTLTTVFINSRLKVMSTTDFILPGLLLSSLVVILVVGLATVFMALYVSHRIAGPVYRLHKDVLSMHAGNLKQIFRLRDHDEMKPLALALNEMARRVQQDITVLKAETEALGTSSDGLAMPLKERLKNIKKVLDAYQV